MESIANPQILCTLHDKKEEIQVMSLKNNGNQPIIQ